MTLVRIQDLADRTARRQAQAWFERFERAHAGDAKARALASEQLQAHLIEALNADALACVEEVDKALARLGEPEAIAADWSDAPLAVSTDTRQQPLLHLMTNLARGVSGVLGILMIAAVLARLNDPSSVGLFKLSDGSWLVGTVNNQTVLKDVLGVWTIPLALALALALLIGASAGLGVWSAIMRWRKRGTISPSS